MCAEAKTIRVRLVCPDTNTIEQLLVELWRRIRIVQCNLGIFDNFRLLSIKNGRGFLRTLCDVKCFWFDLVMRQLLLQERVVSVMDEFNSSELI